MIAEHRGAIDLHWCGEAGTYPRGTCAACTALVEAGKAKRAAKQRTAADRRARPHVYEGVDLRAEARAYARALGLRRMPQLRFIHAASARAP